MIALNQRLRAKLAKRVVAFGVVVCKDWLGCDEQTMMRAAIGVPLRDDVARRIAKTVEQWERRIAKTVEQWETEE